MFQTIKRFQFLEWLWVAYTVCGLAFYGVTRWDNSFFIMVAFFCYEWPTSHLLSTWQFSNLLPPWMRYYFVLLTVLLNGALWYTLLRLCFRRQPAARAVGCSPLRKHLRPVGDFHLRWLRGELADDPVWAHLLLPGAVLWLGLGIYRSSTFLFMAGATVYCVLVAAVVIAERRRETELRAPRRATGLFARMDKTGLLRAQRMTFRIALGLLIGVLISGAYMAWSVP